jgi:hypothetical protein
MTKQKFLLVGTFVALTVINVESVNADANCPFLSEALVSADSHGNSYKTRDECIKKAPKAYEEGKSWKGKQRFFKYKTCVKDTELTDPWVGCYEEIVEKTPTRRGDIEMQPMKK